MSPRPTILVVMGVSGAGKTTVGERLASRLGWTFQEGDTLHPAENITKMKVGKALTDADRAPWLEAIAARIDSLSSADRPAVITCSALRRAYRDLLTGDRPQVRLVFLRGAASIIERRLRERRGHFMPLTLLASQLATLEPPAASEGAIEIDIELPVDLQVAEIIRALAHGDGPIGR